MKAAVSPTNPPGAVGSVWGRALTRTVGDSRSLQVTRFHFVAYFKVDYAYVAGGEACSGLNYSRDESLGLHKYALLFCNT